MGEQDRPDIGRQLLSRDDEEFDGRADGEAAQRSLDLGDLVGYPAPGAEPTGGHVGEETIEGTLGETAYAPSAGSECDGLVGGGRREHPGDVGARARSGAGGHTEGDVVHARESTSGARSSPHARNEGPPHRMHALECGVGYVIACLPRRDRGE